MNWIDNLESRIFQQLRLELRRVSHVLADVLLKTIDPIDAHGEPELEAAEAATQWDLPVAVVHHYLGAGVREVLGLHVECPG